MYLYTMQIAMQWLVVDERQERLETPKNNQTMLFPCLGTLIRKLKKS